jgi:hypothetical protein
MNPAYLQSYSLLRSQLDPHHRIVFTKGSRPPALQWLLLLLHRTFHPLRPRQHWVPRSLPRRRARSVSVKHLVALQLPEATTILFSRSQRCASSSPPHRKRLADICPNTGALYGVLAFFACMAPRATFLIFGIVPCPAWLCISGVFIWDGFSALSGTRKGTDTAGHIGGILGGIGYYILRMRLRI